MYIVTGGGGAEGWSLVIRGAASPNCVCDAGCSAPIAVPVGRNGRGRRGSRYEVTRCGVALSIPSLKAAAQEHIGKGGWEVGTDVRRKRAGTTPVKEVGGDIHRMQSLVIA